MPYSSAAIGIFIPICFFLSTATFINLEIMPKLEVVYMAEKMWFDWVAFVLVIVGAVNWGLVGLFKLDLVALLLGSIPILQTIVYILVGLAGLYLIYYLTKE